MVIECFTIMSAIADDDNDAPTLNIVTSGQTTIIVFVNIIRRPSYRR